jgi:hypothetical protein
MLIQFINKMESFKIIKILPIIYKIKSVFLKLYSRDYLTIINFNQFNHLRN